MSDLCLLSCKVVQEVIEVQCEVPILATKIRDKEVFGKNGPEATRPFVRMIKSTVHFIRISTWQGANSGLASR